MLLPGGLQLAHLRHGVAPGRAGSGLGSQLAGAGHQGLPCHLRRLARLLQGALQALHGGFPLRQQGRLRFARHRMFHGAQLAPFGEMVFQRFGHGAPAAGIVAGVLLRVGQGGFAQGLHQGPACKQVLFALVLQHLQVCGHGFVGGLQRGIKALPQRAAGGAAQVVQLLPAVAHVLDDFGLLLDRQLDGARLGRATGHGGQRLGLLRQFVARQATGPVLPTLELCIAGLHAVDAGAQRGVAGATMQHFVYGHEVLVGLGQMAAIEGGLGFFEKTGQ